MAMIACPECGKQVSSEAPGCPSCGHPIKPPPAPAKKTGLWWGLGCLLAVPALFMVVAVVGLLAAIAIPSFMRARTQSQQNACINNIRQVEAGKEQYGMEHGLTNGDVITWTDIVGPDNYVKHYPLCPSSTTVESTAVNSENDYNINVLGSNAACRIQPTGKFSHALHQAFRLKPTNKK